ncbi:hypothetical protein BDE36_2426 [Arcticibacter tournemirensis]|uniref:Lipoprotein n=1 Tax=Arcticibacter tournemirensis TaxID=699437 RepID=A0A5M9H238_9SPHI|nr:hypothetical protein [Arcticibacter tournemirensis]KAA8480071.1 hypothetical protein F1649_15725 [Arcticibacter tournemirensis]TQM50672.1 hypothetical protein BDE36_2426 [Arcticibacter tournemirensis]
MKTIKLMSTASIALSLITSACSSGPDKEEISERIIGKYAQQGENEFDYFKDTLEVRALEDGKFDVAKIAVWSSAKKSDPQRPSNKVAGVWNHYGPGKTFVAELQAQDTTLRITEPISGAVTILHLDIDKGTLSWPAQDGGESVYPKVK